MVADRRVGEGKPQPRDMPVMIACCLWPQVNPVNKHVPANVFLIPSSGTKQMFNPEDSVRQRVCGMAGHARLSLAMHVSDQDYGAHFYL